VTIATVLGSLSDCIDHWYSYPLKEMCRVSLFSLATGFSIFDIPEGQVSSGMLLDFEHLVTRWLWSVSRNWDGVGWRIMCVMGWFSICILKNMWLWDVDLSRVEATGLFQVMLPYQIRSHCCVLCWLKILQSCLWRTSFIFFVLV